MDKKDPSAPSCYPDLYSIPSISTTETPTYPTIAATSSGDDNSAITTTTKGGN